MALLADEHTSNHRGKPTDREYLYFALALIALLLVSAGASYTPADADGTTVSSP